MTFSKLSQALDLVVQLLLYLQELVVVFLPRLLIWDLIWLARSKLDFQKIHQRTQPQLLTTLETTSVMLPV